MRPGKRFPAGVTWTLIAGTGLAIAVRTAARAESLTVGLAKRPDRPGRNNLITQHILKRKAVPLIIPYFGLLCSNRPCRGLGIGRHRTEDEVVIGGKRNLDRLDAA